jgi:hypothetical protein
MTFDPFFHFFGHFTTLRARISGGAGPFIERKLIADSGRSTKDKNRVILFATKKNLEILNANRDWYGDGTFDIAPPFFKQIYTIHCRVNDHLLPLVYAFLPNKQENTYKKWLFTKNIK